MKQTGINNKLKNLEDSCFSFLKTASEYAYDYTIDKDINSNIATVSTLITNTDEGVITILHPQP